MRYCSRCILPDTRPGLEIGAGRRLLGVPRPRRAARAGRLGRARGGASREIVDEVAALGRPYDCVIPVSGGKDSTWQTATCLEAGLHPLAVTWRTPGRTDARRAQPRNLVELGVDHIDFSVNPKVERRVHAARRSSASARTAVPMHLAIFNVPTDGRRALRRPARRVGRELGARVRRATRGDSFRARRRLGAPLRRRARHDRRRLGRRRTSPRRTSRPYFGPTDAELREQGMRGRLPRLFFEWDPEHDGRGGRARTASERATRARAPALYELRGHRRRLHLAPPLAEVAQVRLHAHVGQPVARDPQRPADARRGDRRAARAPGRDAARGHRALLRARPASPRSASSRSPRRSANQDVWTRRDGDLGDRRLPDPRLALGS